MSLLLVSADSILSFSAATSSFIALSNKACQSFSLPDSMTVVNTRLLKLAGILRKHAKTLTNLNNIIR